jgi:hypothetical protein
MQFMKRAVISTGSGPVTQIVRQRGLLIENCSLG